MSQAEVVHQDETTTIPDTEWALFFNELKTDALKQKEYGDPENTALEGVKNHFFQSNGSKLGRTIYTHTNPFSYWLTDPL